VAKRRATISVKSTTKREVGKGKGTGCSSDKGKGGKGKSGKGGKGNNDKSPKSKKVNKSPTCTAAPTTAIFK
jgi:hypothetical protein